MNRKRILVIEDNPVLRERINAMLAREPEMRVVATLGSGDNILVKIRETQPEMVLLGVGLNHTTEASVIALARELAPGINVICMGLVPSYPGIASLVEAGAAGFILEDATEKDFLATMRNVIQGANVLPPPMTRFLFLTLVEAAGRKRKEEGLKAVQMTRREREISMLIAGGLSNKEIGKQLNITTYTVKSHLHNLMAKLAIHTRLQIVKTLDNGRS